MSNDALKSRLHQLKSELSSLEDYNSELCGELSSISRGVRRANEDLLDCKRSLKNTLVSSHDRLVSSHQRVVDAIELQCEIERMYVRFKHMELANKKIREANNKKYYDFANYRNVRKIVQAIMDNLDVNMVSDEAIRKAVEVQHLQAPDYWLTCVLISVMAWRNDDRELADRAIARAVMLDKKDSAIFYMLFNLRMGREDAALKWFDAYQDCAFQGSDRHTFLMMFSLVSKTLTDQVSESTKQQVQAFIQRVVEANMRDSDYDEADVVSRVRKHFNRMQSSEQPEYPMLRKYCTEFNALSDVLLQAGNNINILDFILRTVHVPAEQRNIYLKDYIDELIKTPNQTEKAVYDDIAYNETVIQLRGDTEKAREVFAAAQARKETDLNLVSEMIDWIYVRDSQDINGQIRRNMFTLTKPLQELAVDSHVEDYRSRRRSSCQVQIGEYSANVDFSDPDAQNEDVTAFFTGQREKSIATLRKWPAFAAFGISLLGLIAVFFLDTYMLLVALGGVCIGIFTLYTNKILAKMYEQACLENIRATHEILGKLFLEFRQYQAELDEYDAYYERIKNELSKL